jgi:hypothetical protein
VNQFSVFSRNIAVIASVGLSIISLSGCNNKNIGNPFPKPAAVVVLVDRSVAGFQAREDQFQEIDSLAKSANEAGSVFALWSYDSAPKSLWSPSQLPSPDILDTLETHSLAHISVSAKIESRPDLAIDKLTQDPVMQTVFGRVYILSDGRDSSPAAEKTLTKSLGQLAAKQGWRLAVLGITPQYRQLWQTATSSTFGSRADLVDQKTALSTLAENRDE